MFIMRFMATLIIFGIFPLASVAKRSDGKIVVCAASTQTVLNVVQSNFNIQTANWQYCTHIVVLEKHLRNKGTRNGKIQKARWK